MRFEYFFIFMFRVRLCDDHSVKNYASVLCTKDPGSNSLRTLQVFIRSHLSKGNGKPWRVSLSHNHHGNVQME